MLNACVFISLIGRMLWASEATKTLLVALSIDSGTSCLLILNYLMIRLCATLVRYFLVIGGAKICLLTIMKMPSFAFL